MASTVVRAADAPTARANSSRLRSGRSGAASITSSQPARPSSDRRPSRAARPRRRRRGPWPPSARSPSRTRRSPASSASGSGSCSSVRIPAAQPSCAMPAPIVPAPTTPRITARGTPAGASRRRRSCPRRGPRWPSPARTAAARARARRVSGGLVGRQHRLLAEPHRQRRPAGHDAGQLQRRVEPAVARRHLVDDPEPVAPRAASMRRPVSTSSIARCLPITRASRWVPPPPGMIPSRISGWPNSADSEATIMSHASASSQPPPSA